MTTNEARNIKRLTYPVHNLSSSSKNSGQQNKYSTREKKKDKKQSAESILIILTRLYEFNPLMLLFT